MTDNPYQAPQFQPEAIRVESPGSRRARFWLRATAIVLFLPAIYNYWEFDRWAVSPMPHDLEILCRSANILGLVVGGAFVWFLGLRTLETLAHVLRWTLASRTDRTAWDAVLLQSIPRMIYVAVPGAALWVVWVFAFYEARANVLRLSWAVGIAAHLLAACWYVPLAYRWYRLATNREA